MNQTAVAMKQRDVEHGFPPPVFEPTALRVLFCMATGIRPQDFERVVFRRCASRHVRLLAHVPGTSAALFHRDRELIARAGEAVALTQVRAAIDDYWSDGANYTWVRRAARLRISTLQLRRLASEFLPREVPTRRAPNGVD